GLSVDDVNQRTHIDPWFLNHMREIVQTEDELRACPSLEAASPELLLRAKQEGFSDPQLAHLWNRHDQDVRRHRKALGIEAVFKLVDTCAAEFEAFTPYYYSTYETPIVELGARHSERGNEDRDFRASRLEDETRPHAGKDRIMILGGGPNRIGQGIE